MTTSNAIVTSDRSNTSNSGKGLIASLERRIKGLWSKSGLTKPTFNGLDSLEHREMNSGTPGLVITPSYDGKFDIVATGNFVLVETQRERINGKDDASVEIWTDKAKTTSTTMPASMISFMQIKGADNTANKSDTLMMIADGVVPFGVTMVGGAGPDIISMIGGDPSNDVSIRPGKKGDVTIDKVTVNSPAWVSTYTESGMTYVDTTKAAKIGSSSYHYAVTGAGTSSITNGTNPIIVRPYDETSGKVTVVSAGKWNNITPGNGEWNITANGMDNDLYIDGSRYVSSKVTYKATDGDVWLSFTGPLKLVKGSLIDTSKADHSYVSFRGLPSTSPSSLDELKMQMSLGGSTLKVADKASFYFYDNTPDVDGGKGLVSKVA